jgi:hypothetical protein
MTLEDELQEMIERAERMFGPDGLSTRALKTQLAAIKKAHYSSDEFWGKTTKGKKNEEGPDGR